MRRALPIVGWTVLGLFLTLVALEDYAIVSELYRPPEGPWPGWMPLIESNLLYGGGGILIALATRWVWRRIGRRDRMLVR